LQRLTGDLAQEPAAALLADQGVDEKWIFIGLQGRRTCAADSIARGRSTPNQPCSNYTVFRFGDARTDCRRFCGWGIKGHQRRVQYSSNSAEPIWHQKILIFNRDIFVIIIKLFLTQYLL
jgi:hypothetical protein